MRARTRKLKRHLDFPQELTTRRSEHSPILHHSFRITRFPQTKRPPPISHLRQQHGDLSELVDETCLHQCPFFPALQSGSERLILPDKVLVDQRRGGLLVLKQPLDRTPENLGGKILKKVIQHNNGGTKLKDTVRMIRSSSGAG